MAVSKALILELCEEIIETQEVPDALLQAVQAVKDATTLTRREREILRLLADGLTMDATGRALHISGLTVKSHVRRILGKLHARNTTHVALFLRQEAAAKPAISRTVAP